MFYVISFGSLKFNSNNLMLRIMIKIIKETPGIEPGTSRSAVECSTTELYLLLINFILHLAL
jgi:hypothetical protein